MERTQSNNSYYQGMNKVSSSLIDTRNLQAMHNFLRMSSNREEGWLEIDFSNKSYNFSNGQPRRVVFDYEKSSGGTLDIYEDNETQPVLTIPMGSVMSYKTDGTYKSIKLMTTGDQKLILRSNDPEEIKRWLFTFQKSVALVLSAIIKGNDTSSPDHGASPSDKPMALPFHPSTIFTSLPSTNFDDMSAFVPSNDEQSNVLSRRQSLNRSPNHLSTERRRTYGSDFVLNNSPYQPSPTNAGISAFGGAINRQISIDGEAQMIRNRHQQAANNLTGRPPVSPSAMMMSSSYHASSTGYLSTPINIARNSYITPNDSPSNYNNHSGLHMARSPVIPINSPLPSNVISHSIQADNDSDTKLSGSYIEEDGIKSVFESAMQTIISEHPQVQHRDSISSTASDASFDIKQNDGDMLFDMEGLSPRDDNIRQVSRSAHHIPSKHVSTSSRKLHWESGSCTLLGQRKSNEDRFLCQDNIISSSTSSSSDEKLGFFAVYDGHTGDDASVYLEQNLHLEIIKHPLFEDDIIRAIEETCYDVDNRFVAICRQRKKDPGSTAIGVFLRRDELILFNIGDSCAVLCSDGSMEEIMQAHKPNRPDEQERIKKANGWITEERELFLARLHMMNINDPWIRSKAEKLGWVVIYRICGEIAVSRSIGDPIYKNFTPGEQVQEYFNWPEGHNQAFMADLVIPMPECKVMTITKKQDFLIVASDGLWDVVSSQEAIERAHGAFNAGKSCTEVAEDLCELAIQLGSTDNVTVVVVRFIHSID